MERLDELRGARRTIAELLALLYIAIIATIASITGAVFVLFPELGALSHDVMTRPRGSWARAPVLLIVTPVATAAIGTLVTRHLPYGYLSVLFTVGSALAVILALDSPIAPAISAGFLPLVLGVKSWWYPPAIVLGTTMLAAQSHIWQRFGIDPETTITEPDVRITIHRTPPFLSITCLMLFVTLGVFAVEFTKLRFILFPPLVVIGFEMFVHTETCPWAERPMGLPIACLLTAAGGLAARHFCGTGPLASIISMGWGIAVLRVFDLHVPPALAVALLPQVMEAPTILYPLSVGLGTTLLSGSFLFFRRFQNVQLSPVDSRS